jgi:Holliday junction DNA helicase RuvB
VAASDNSRRLLAGQAGEEDAGFDLSLRPHRLSEYIGQNKAKEQLALAIEAARSRGEPLDHVLLYGPPGLGKTTLAGIIAEELSVAFQSTAGPLIQIKGDLTAILTTLQARQVLFFDEVHRLQPQLEEILYSALEDYRLDIIIGQGPAARTHTMTLEPFTFVAATTRAGLVSAPLRSRFGLILRLEFYEPKDLETILHRSAGILGVPMDAEGGAVLARRCRGTPRIANRLLRRVRDFAQVRAQGRITVEVAEQALKLLEVDEYGFDEADRRLMLALMEKFDGGPVGVNTLAAALAEEPDAIEEIYEPFLMQIGFLNRTPRGRVATALAYRHFRIAPPRARDDQQAGLFTA